MTIDVLSLPNDIHQQIARSPHKGIACKFVQISPEWGIKAYHCESIRDKSYENQIIYARVGYAPPAGDKFRLGDYYCYGTRVAETLVDMNCSDEYFDEQEEEWEDTLLDLVDEMRDNGLNPDDIHVGNFGHYEGNLVMIDLGMD